MLDTCVLCGAVGETTDDHIPPKSLYTKRERTSAKYQFHTVKACAKCNGGGSPYDEVLKLFIGIESGEDRATPDDVIDALAGTLKKNQRLAKSVFSAKLVYQETPTGIRVPTMAIQVDETYYKEVICRIVKAMYWRVTGAVLDPSAKIGVSLDRRFNQEVVAEQRTYLEEINGGTFKYKLIETEVGEMMVMQFFNKHSVVALIE